MSIMTQLCRELSTSSQVHGLVDSTIGHFYYVRPIATDSPTILAERVTLTLPTRLLKEKIEVCVGDFVAIDPDSKRIKGVIPRRSFLQKPSAANLDRAIIICAITEPEPELENLDRLLCLSGISLPQKPLICVTKVDLVSSIELLEPYRQLGYEMITLSNSTGAGISLLRSRILGQSVVLAGRSGVGKSSILKQLCPDREIKIGAVSRKNTQGTHTTRFSSLIGLGGIEDSQTFVLDTPGFSRLDMRIDPEDLLSSKAFPEIGQAKSECFYAGCRHRGEEGCQVIFSPERWRSYKKFMEESESYAGEKRETRKLKEGLLAPKQSAQTTVPLLNPKQRDSSRKTLKQKHSFFDREEKYSGGL